jgi:hypothetical protein
MPRSRKTNRDHAKQKQRPIPEDEVIGAELEALVTPALEAIFKKLDSLESVPRGQLAGKIGVVIDLITRLPVEIWFQENAKASEIPSKFPTIAAL